MKLTKFLSFRFKYRILLFLKQFKKLSYFKDCGKENKNKAYIFLAADYGNLGDIAITYAQTLFLKEHLPDHQIIEIPISKSLEGLWFVKRSINNNDLVTTVGGGNLGDMYDQIEFIRQLVVQFFPNNKIILFPQTFDFSNSPKGLRALKKAKKVYSKHKNLFWLAREKVSYELMKKHFNKSKVILTPDIVLSLDKSKPEMQREGAIICLRNDKEKKLTEEQSVYIQKWANSNFSSVSDYDTHINKNEMSVSERMGELNKIWNAFKTAELVITDRLHGMIFCQITQTPCLVFSNSNHKIEATYHWIKNCENIILMNKFKEKEFLQIFQEKNFLKGEWKSLKYYYKSLVEILKN